MRKKVSDGWHMICGYKVYVEDGKILRGISGEGNSQKTVYPFRKNRVSGWDNVSGLTVDAFRAGISRGTIMMA